MKNVSNSQIDFDDSEYVKNINDKKLQECKTILENKVFHKSFRENVFAAVKYYLQNVQKDAKRQFFDYETFQHCENIKNFINEEDEVILKYCDFIEVSLKQGVILIGDKKKKTPNSLLELKSNVNVVREALLGSQYTQMKIKSQDTMLQKKQIQEKYLKEINQYQEILYALLKNVHLISPITNCLVYSLSIFYEECEFLPDPFDSDYLNQLQTFREHKKVLRRELNEQENAPKSTKAFIRLQQVKDQVLDIQEKQIEILEKLEQLLQIGKLMRLQKYTLNVLEEESWNELKNILSFFEEGSYDYFRQTLNDLFSSFGSEAIGNKMKEILYPNVEELFLYLKQNFKSLIPFLELYQKINRGIKNWDLWVISLQDISDIEEYYKRKEDVNKLLLFLEEVLFIQNEENPLIDEGYKAKIKIVGKYQQIILDLCNTIDVLKFHVKNQEIRPTSKEYFHFEENVNRNLETNLYLAEVFTKHDKEEGHNQQYIGFLQTILDQFKKLFHLEHKRVLDQFLKG